MNGVVGFPMRNDPPGHHARVSGCESVVRASVRDTQAVSQSALGAAGVTYSLLPDILILVAEHKPFSSALAVQLRLCHVIHQPRCRLDVQPDRPLLRAQLRCDSPRHSAPCGAQAARLYYDGRRKVRGAAPRRASSSGQRTSSRARAEHRCVRHPGNTWNHGTIRALAAREALLEREPQRMRILRDAVPVERRCVSQCGRFTPVIVNDSRCASRRRNRANSPRGGPLSKPRRSFGAESQKKQKRCDQNADSSPMNTAREGSSNRRLGAPAQRAFRRQRVQPVPNRTVAALSWFCIEI